MLFPYKYVPHSIDKLQKYIDFLFLEVWCKADGEYNIERLNRCPELKDIVLDIYHDDKIKTDHLYGPIENIFNSFKKLSRKKRKTLRKWYAANSSIDKLCSNEPGYRGKHYKELEIFQKSFRLTKHYFNKLKDGKIPNDILSKLECLQNQAFKNEKGFLKVIETQIGKKQTDNHKELILKHAIFHDDISAQLEVFFKNLWENVLDLDVVKNRVGNIRGHYIAFMKQNDEEVCPFCGLNDLKGVYLSKRDAYDHFLPKHIYAFNSINFKNLAPMCHECNSSYKLQQNPLYVLPHRDPLRSKENHRRKAFYPYLNEQVDISLSIHLKIRDIQHLTPDEIELTLSSADHQEEVETWMEIFGIEERFKEKCCKKNVGKAWVQTVTEEIQNVKELTGIDIQAKQWVEKIKNQCQHSLWHERNFLKKAFLEACERAGVF